ncbi:MAG: TetR/AcrR family transcriptional regulator [Spirochaetes bacterium]|nr:TetR/AcrR family transcriptional regulator [Spirochaetota bacterium]MBU1078980.1 TetR/AcrR family transcriptional regulator [Spirochaetota bacterium]
MKKNDQYHHGHLREELLRLGLESIETAGTEGISLRSLADKAGVSKAAPYRHFSDKEAYLGALADEGFRLLCIDLERADVAGTERIASMGAAYMEFAVARPSLYRLMNSPLLCRLPDGSTPWARKSLLMLAEALRKVRSDPGTEPSLDVDAAVAAWAYIHGLVLIRIDGLFPRDLPAPDWARLAAAAPSLGA